MAAVAMAASAEAPPGGSWGCPCSYCSCSFLSSLSRSGRRAFTSRTTAAPASPGGGLGVSPLKPLAASKSAEAFGCFATAGGEEWPLQSWTSSREQAGQRSTAATATAAAFLLGDAAIAAAAEAPPGCGREGGPLQRVAAAMVSPQQRRYRCGDISCGESRCCNSRCGNRLRLDN